MITLFGTIRRDTTDGRLLLDVWPQLGDAARFGLAGEVWIGRRQCKQVIEATAYGQLDVVKISYPVAVALAQAAGVPIKRSH